MSGRVPTVTGDLEGWERVETGTETVFRLPTGRVDAHTVLYEDTRLGEIGGGDDADGPWRFLFATRLAFHPPLAPGIGPVSVYPAVASEAASAFADRLRERGGEDVARERTGRMRVDTGDRARLWKYTARYGSSVGPVDLEGWAALWVAGGEFLMAGGAYPTRGPGDASDALENADLDRGRYREETLALIRSVE